MAVLNVNSSPRRPRALKSFSTASAAPASAARMAALRRMLWVTRSGVAPDARAAA